MDVYSAMKQSEMLSIIIELLDRTMVNSSISVIQLSGK